MYYYCNCTEEKTASKEKAVKNGRTPYRVVLADDDGVCESCGYYAMAYPKLLDVKGGELRRLMENL